MKIPVKREILINIPFIHRESGHIHFEHRKFESSDKELFDLFYKRKQEIPADIEVEIKEVYGHPLDRIKDKAEERKEKERRQKQATFDEMERSMQKKGFYGGEKAVNEGDKQELSEDYWGF